MVFSSFLLKLIYAHHFCLFKHNVQIILYCALYTRYDPYTEYGLYNIIRLNSHRITTDRAFIVSSRSPAYTERSQNVKIINDKNCHMIPVLL